MTEGRRARHKATMYALSQSPDRIGVGRLCQELLADVTGQEIGFRAEKPVRINAQTGRRARKCMETV